MNGTDITISVESGTTGTYVLLASQRDATITETTDAIDVSNKDAREGAFVPGRYSATLDLDALYIPADAAYIDLKDAMRNGTNVRVELIEGVTDIENIDGVVTSLSRSAPDQGESIVSASMQLTGAWVAA
jgi:TP901-1 family phage major tail protein